MQKHPTPNQKTYQVKGQLCYLFISGETISGSRVQYELICMILDVLKSLK